MKGIVIRWLVLTAAITVASYVIEGIHVAGFFSALLGAAMLGILNVFFRPVILILTLPINLLTLGLFTFVINAVILMMASGVIRGFDVSGFGSAILGALVISIVSWLLNSFIDGQGRISRVDYIDLKRREDGRWEL
jgi:putative membrane protein